MHNYKVTLSYLGTAFSGWQIQKSDRTVQGELNKVLQVLNKQAVIKTTGCGRTDAGVHALDQVVKIVMPLEIECSSLIKALNSQLPHDIKVLKAELCSEDFKPTVDAVKKTYRYYFSLADKASPLDFQLVTNIPYKLDIEKMKEAAGRFVGEFDFTSYKCVGTVTLSTVREIFSSEIKVCDSNHMFGNERTLYFLEITGNGFLKQMVRLIMGTLFEIGKSKILNSDIDKSLTTAIGPKIGHTAPPQGLYLYSVEY
jgi:tRNA pseudouridine38-40 synthase